MLEHAYTPIETATVTPPQKESIARLNSFLGGTLSLSLIAARLTSIAHMLKYDGASGGIPRGAFKEEFQDGSPAEREGDPTLKELVELSESMREQVALEGELYRRLRQAEVGYVTRLAEVTRGLARRNQGGILDHRQLYGEMDRTRPCGNPEVIEPLLQSLAEVRVAGYTTLMRRSSLFDDLMEHAETVDDALKPIVSEVYEAVGSFPKALKQLRKSNTPP
jgi:hypothetical protein